MSVYRQFLLLAAFFALAAGILEAQPALPQPAASPAAVMSQTIGITQITISYHRPAVKGREVWGGLVPYGDVWRAGANENTIISFSKAVTVGGKPLNAGTYGLHMIPTKGEWTVIFSNNSTSWGSFFYKQEEDAVRIPASPGPEQSHEWLAYEFSDLTDSSAILSLCWEKLRIPITIATDTRKNVLTVAREEYLRGPAGFTWQGFNQAAVYAVNNGGDVNEALQWANRSTAIAETFANLRTKAQILEMLGKKEEAATLRVKSMKLANEADINSLGYALMAQNKTQEAREMFEKNVKDHPDSWNVYDSLAELQEKSGDVKNAIRNYEQALKRVTDEGNRTRITRTLQRLQQR